MRKIIVLGIVHHNTLGMIRCLGLANYRVDLVLIGQDGYVSKSTYVQRTTILKDEAELIDILLKMYSNEKEKPIIFACTDKIGSVLDYHYKILKDFFHFFNCGEEEKATFYMNKQVQINLANSVGITIPFSYEYKGVLEKTKYPCLLKPVQSIHGGKKVIICSNDKELKKGISSFSKSEIIQVQQFIRKDEEIVVLGCSINTQVIIPGYILKHRDFDGGTLYSTVCPINELPSELVVRCKELIQSMNYQGLFGIEFIKSNGKYYFIEVNLRNDATTYALAVAGVNLPNMYINLLLGKEIMHESIPKQINSIVEFNDFKHRKDFNVSIYAWLKQCFNSKCKYYWNSSDPLPFFFAPFK